MKPCQHTGANKGSLCQEPDNRQLSAVESTSSQQELLAAQPETFALMASCHSHESRAVTLALKLNTPQMWGQQAQHVLSQDPGSYRCSVRVRKARSRRTWTPFHGPLHLGVQRLPRLLLLPHSGCQIQDLRRFESEHELCGAEQGQHARHATSQGAQQHAHRRTQARGA